MVADHCNSTKRRNILFMSMFENIKYPTKWQKTQSNLLKLEISWDISKVRIATFHWLLKEAMFEDNVSLEYSMERLIALDDTRNLHAVS
jgi:hypothetical protein